MSGSITNHISVSTTNTSSVTAGEGKSSTTQPRLTLKPGNIARFDQLGAASANVSHRRRFSETAVSSALSRVKNGISFLDLNMASITSK